MQSLTMAVIIGGAVAGILDIGAAAAINRVDPKRILRIVASGILGHGAMTGADAPYLGFFLQVAMGIFIAAIYAVASLWIPLLASMWMMGGLAYGIAIFFVMTYVVVPLSAAPRRPPALLSKHSKDMLAMLGFGLIVAYAVYIATL
ncbi:hypothetical protein AB4Z52_27130 [Rhizobium sp. 2YAF20]|uniref:hypothetical protein n=1 Tax=Rhizobium sp. 2YAF20 TaxID=3233027 RepID=UPI003F9893F3